MKDQYFGDEHDYVKLSLLRAMSAAGLKVFVDWMMTPSDGGGDGRRHQYLTRTTWRKHDPELYDWLASWYAQGGRKDVERIERSGLLAARFFSEGVPRQPAPRAARWQNMIRSLSGSDIVFLDADNGLEVASVRPGSADYPKYISYDELRALWNTGVSMIVYQHIARVERETFIAAIRAKLADLVPNAIVLAVTTSYVVFFMIVTPQHLERVNAAVATLHTRWSPRLRLSDLPRVESVRLPMRRPRSKTTAIGYLNPHGQQVVASTGLPGTDHLQRIYILECRRCLQRYGTNGSSIHEKKCPACQDGSAGLHVGEEHQ